MWLRTTPVGNQIKVASANRMVYAEFPISLIFESKVGWTNVQHSPTEHHLSVVRCIMYLQVVGT